MASTSSLSSAFSSMRVTFLRSIRYRAPDRSVNIQLDKLRPPENALCWCEGGFPCFSWVKAQSTGALMSHPHQPLPAIRDTIVSTIRWSWFIARVLKHRLLVIFIFIAGLRWGSSVSLFARKLPDCRSSSAACLWVEGQIVAMQNIRVWMFRSHPMSSNHCRFAFLLPLRLICSTHGLQEIPSCDCIQINNQNHQPGPDWLDERQNQNAWSHMRQIATYIFQAAIWGRSAIAQSQVECGFDFITVPLVDPVFKRPACTPGQIKMPYSWSDLLLVSAQYGSQVMHVLPNHQLSLA